MRARPIIARADTLRGLAADDALNGATGADTARGSDSGVTVELTTGMAPGGDAEGDTLRSIENRSLKDRNMTTPSSAMPQPTG